MWVQYLHCVGGVLVVEDEGLLDVLVESLQLVNFRHVRHDALLVLLQVGQLVLQSAVHFNGYPANFLPTQTRSIYHLDFILHMQALKFLQGILKLSHSSQSGAAQF